MEIGPSYKIIVDNYRQGLYKLYKTLGLCREKREKQMTERLEQQLPLARRNQLLIEELTDEVLVYDLDRQKAHCLNRTAALIWNHCDGQTSIEELVNILERHSETSISQDVVWFGLDQLQKARLIERAVARPADKARLSRRELVKQIGLAVSIPLVVSILAPTASAGISCLSACLRNRRELHISLHVQSRNEFLHWDLITGLGVT